MATPQRYRPVPFQRTAARIVAAGRRVPGVRSVLLSPAVARPGHMIATAGGLLWGGFLSRFRIRRAGRLVVCTGLPRWAFGRGGTTIGAVYLTRDQVRRGVLEHEDVHRRQWKRYGLAFPLLYLAAGADPRTNRFEIEAGLGRGGYR
ncbi:hypothetical protein ACFFGH_31855 [Lysobacter korlensis]|uniref:Fe-S oxidoreductase n=1 Tax=Lysobacter korlensis TaxID=553636 RepID=A0ABV6S0U5_9GAMM